MAEFRCEATELRLVRTPPGSTWTRSIDPFCSEPRAVRFGKLLTDYPTCCAACNYLSLRPDTPIEGEPPETSSAEMRESA
jgi:hypothetical protein